MSEELTILEQGVQPRRRHVAKLDPQARLYLKFISALTIKIEKPKSACRFEKAEDFPLKLQQAESIVEQIKEIQKNVEWKILSDETLHELVSFFRKYNIDDVIRLIENSPPKEYFLQSGRYFSSIVEEAEKVERKLKSQLLYEPLGALLCPKCKQNALIMNSNQTTRADEGITIYRNCTNCGFSDTQR